MQKVVEKRKERQQKRSIRQCTEPSRRRHSYPAMSLRDPDYRNFLYLVECGTLELPLEFRRAQTTLCSFCSIPVQEQGRNCLAAKKKSSLVVQSRSQPRPREQRMKLSELVVNYHRQPDLADEKNLEVIFKDSKMESSVNASRDSVFVHGR